MSLRTTVRKDSRADVLGLLLQRPSSVADLCPSSPSGRLSSLLQDLCLWNNLMTFPIQVLYFFPFSFFFFY